MKEHRGLIECPMQQSYVKFSYSDGDLVRDLRPHVAKKWGVAAKKEHGYLNFHRDARWVFLCQEETGSYLRIGDDEPIPTGKPKSNEAIRLVGGNHFEQHFLTSHSKMPLMQFFFLRERGSGRRQNQDIDDLMATKFRIDMPSLERAYELPDEEYDVRLLVIPALVGG